MGSISDPLQRKVGEWLYKHIEQEISSPETLEPTAAVSICEEAEEES